MGDVATTAEQVDRQPSAIPRPRLYYGWVCVAAAALAMVATLPGRTVGLGLATEPLLRDLGISRTAYAAVNLWATLLGAGFALAGGRLLDRLGARVVLPALAALLGLAVLAMSRAAGPWGLFAAVTLTRGLGQSALSAASIALVGKWFDRRAGPAMGTYAVLLTLGFVAAIPALDAATRHAGWRASWGGTGLVLALVVAPLLWAAVRSSPEAVGLPLDGRPRATAGDPAVDNPSLAAVPPAGHTLRDALATPAFWALAGGGFVFNAAYAGVTLFNESVLAERGFAGPPTGPLVVIMSAALASNLLAGWLIARTGGDGRGPGRSVTRLIGAAMLLLGGSLLALPQVRTAGQVMAYAATMGVSAGVVTVVFFACWGRLYGRRHLGQVQGAAQALTVLASAAGPAFLAQCHARTGSYAPAFYTCAALAVGLGFVCWVVPVPTPAVGVVSGRKGL